MFKITFKVLVAVLLIGTMVEVKAKSDFSVLFVNPSVSGEPFWQKVQTITEQTAAQLNIKMDTIYGEGNRHIQLAELKKYLSYRATPDYVILMNYPGGAEATLDLLDKYGINFLTLEQTITGPERKSIGMPKERYKTWLGEVYHDNYDAGWRLAEALLSDTGLANTDINALIINGHYGSESDVRSQGAQAFLMTQKITVQQRVHASWSKEQAYEKTKKLLSRYPNTNLIWTASDLMAMGALTGVKAAKLEHAVAIGGFDWLGDAIDLVDNGGMSATIGGHFMMGGWALVTLSDHFHKHPFWHDNSSLTFKLGVISRQNLDDYRWIVYSPDWSLIDYKAMSLIGTDDIEYGFSLSQLQRSAEK
ncbi:ABC transporter substrate-binding protein [Pseudoalteromonas citrea]|uniref:Sugar ABC transporter substrate-binding protein n=1 Tax=Pseudoalteromonas citrea DSM 8771 TaxID=1117314 RepID=U1JAY8_9GAMM|nr:ABC transporter substrate-binding protein [Pseudoalteromonas citrea]